MRKIIRFMESVLAKTGDFTRLFYSRVFRLKLGQNLIRNAPKIYFLRLKRQIILSLQFGFWYMEILPKISSSQPGLLFVAMNELP